MTRIIGLTGGSGAGKGMAARCFRQLGAGVVDADAIYRTLCEENRLMLEKLRCAFGDVLTAAGTLDRAKLAQIVFSSSEKLAELNRITYPFIEQASKQAFDLLVAQGFRILIYDAPTLFQTGADAMCSAVIGVVADRATRVSRIISRDNLSAAAALARIDAQPDASFYRARCEYILENDGTPEALCEQVKAIWAQLI